VRPSSFTLCLAALAAAGILLPAALAQPLEFTIPIPDSLGVPGQVVFASGEGKLYCFLPAVGQLAVIDPEARAIVGFVPVGRGLDTLTYGRQWQRLYCTGDSGLAFIRTTDDSIVFRQRDWGRSRLRLDPAQCRAFVSSDPSMLRSVDASDGSVLDSLPGSTAGGWIVFDPLHVRLWGQFFGLVDCSNALTYVGSLPGISGPLVNPWDGLVYGYTFHGIRRHDLAACRSDLWWATDSTEVWGLALNAPGNRLYFYHQSGYGSEAYDLKTISVTSRAVTVGIYGTIHGGAIFFAIAGRRVWAVEDGAGRTWSADETLRQHNICEPVGVLQTAPSCDCALQRTYIVNPTARQLIVFRDTTRDSSDVAAALVVGPHALIDTGACVVIRSSCVNMGVSDKQVLLRLRVFRRDTLDQLDDSEFIDSSVVTVGGNDWATAVFDTWRPAVCGEHVAEVTVEYPGDVNPVNDTARTVVRVLGPYRDVRAVSVPSPPGMVDSGATVIPTALISNLGGVDVEFPVRIAIGTDYADTQTVFLASGDSAWVSFTPWTALEPGMLPICCSTMLARDSVRSNDRQRRSVWVVTRGSVTGGESIPSTYTAGDWTPNPARRLTQLRYGLPEPADVSVAVYSTAGICVRRMLSGVEQAGYHSVTWDGRDDAGRSSAPGVYFCRVRAGPLQKSMKLTIVR
jgi:hypothetical protein